MIANAKRSKTAIKHTAVTGIAVADQIVRCPFPAVGLRELIGDPLSRRCFPYISIALSQAWKHGRGRACAPPM